MPRLFDYHIPFDLDFGIFLRQAIFVTYSDGKHSVDTIYKSEVLPKKR